MTNETGASTPVTVSLKIANGQPANVTLRDPSGRVLAYLDAAATTTLAGDLLATVALMNPEPDAAAAATVFDGDEPCPPVGTWFRDEDDWVGEVVEPGWYVWRRSPAGRAISDTEARPWSESSDIAWSVTVVTPCAWCGRPLPDDTTSDYCPAACPVGDPMCIEPECVSHRWCEDADQRDGAARDEHDRQMAHDRHTHGR